MAFPALIIESERFRNCGKKSEKSGIISERNWWILGQKCSDSNLKSVFCHDFAGKNRGKFLCYHVAQSPVTAHNGVEVRLWP